MHKWPYNSLPTENLASFEAYVLTTLEQIKQTLVQLEQLPERETYKQTSQQYANRLQQLSTEHRCRKQQRKCDRIRYRQQLQGNALVTALADLTKASQQDSTERRQLKQEREKAIAPFTDVIAQADQQIQTLKQQYKTLSKQWQTHIQLAYSVPETAPPLQIIYQDKDLIVIDKPAGLLSVPGRRYHLQDSVLSRLRHRLPEQTFLQPVHRLDQATSGVLAIALTPAAHRNLSQQFAQRQVHKTYEAVLSRPVERSSGTIDLPLWADPQNRPKQFVHFQKGKLSQTDFKILSSGNNPRVQFTPFTGRTHQLRVHAAHPQGLNAPIVGDTLYNANQTEKRLLLHATTLRVLHPITGKEQRFASSAAF
ncbi:MAG: pseudouridine synthase [Phormidesmis sp.]